MADEAPNQDLASAPAEIVSAPSEAVEAEKAEPVLNGSIADAATERSKEVATEADATSAPAPEPQLPESETLPTTNDKPVSATPPPDKPATTQEDIEMKESINPEDAAPAAEQMVDPAVGDSASGDKSKGRRKSGAVPEHKKKLNKKASKAKMTHTDAQPGDYFFVRLKGYPLWPAIVCDESMLPNTLLKSRPVTAARPDGSYRADYEDGGNKVKDRTFPVMYLHTNEFGWIPNYDLVDLDLDTVGDVAPSNRKDLYSAHLLAAERHDLNYFKQILKNFMEARAAEIEAKEAAKAAKKASKAKRKSKVTVGDDEDEDAEMIDAPLDADSGEGGVDAASAEKPKKSKKRKVPADVDATTPQRDDSVKKPKTTIKLSMTPKTTNGTATPQTSKDSTKKTSKPKSKKDTSKADAAVPVEPELTPEEKRQKKEKEILFLRHKLQKGLLTRDQEPKEEEMKQMSEYVLKLEGYADLEVAIIRITKINKVLKAILKLPFIPKEDEFQFKPRSQVLLDKWNMLLATEQGSSVTAPTPSTGATAGSTSTATTNGTTEDAKATSLEAVNPVAPAVTAETNGVKESSNETKIEDAAPVVTDAPSGTTEEVSKNEAADPIEQSAKEESIAEPTSVEATA